jgi:hypothetical protein
VSPLKIKIPSKNCVKNQQMQQLLIQFINYVWYLLHVSALRYHPRRALLLPSERCSIAEQSIEYCGWACCISDVVRFTHHATRHNKPIHNILSTDPQFSISQKALATLPENGNVIPKHVGDKIHN